MSKAAIIDLGTNTFHLMLVEGSANEGFVVKEKITNPVKLGKGGVHLNMITPEAFKRGIQALRAFAEVLKSYPDVPVFAFGTSALRDATNAKDFVEAAKNESGIEINIISGEEEALLIHKGVCKAFKNLPVPSLILDIGGGSVEIVMTNGNQVDFAKSYNLGAARLLGLFNPKDPISQNEIQTIKSHLKAELEGALENANHIGPINLIGSSGSFETFAEILYQRKIISSNPTLQPSLTLPEHELTELFSELLNSNYAQREVIPGMAPMRVEMIVMAVLITQVVLENTQCSGIWLSDYAMKEGMIETVLGK